MEVIIEIAHFIPERQIEIVDMNQEVYKLLFQFRIMPVVLLKCQVHEVLPLCVLGEFDVPPEPGQGRTRQRAA